MTSPIITEDAKDVLKKMIVAFEQESLGIQSILYLKGPTGNIGFALVYARFEIRPGNIRIYTGPSQIFINGTTSSVYIVKNDNWALVSYREYIIEPTCVKCRMRFATSDPEWPVDTVVEIFHGNGAISFDQGRIKRTVRQQNYERVDDTSEVVLDTVTKHIRSPSLEIIWKYVNITKEIV